MIITILIWIYTLVVTYLLGWAFFNAVLHILRIKNKVQVNSALIWISGLCCLSTLASFLSLFIKIGLAANIILSLTCLTIYFAIWKRRMSALPLIPTFDLQKIGAPGWILLILMFLTVLIISVGVPSNPDTALYHAQTIHWIESYKAVPGLVNLHSRLAYSSNWMVINAFFSFAFLGKNSFHLMNSALFLVVMLYLFGGVNGLLRSDLKISNIIKTLLFPTAFFILASEVSSPGNDLPVALLSWVILSELIVLFEQDRADRNITLFIFLVSVFIVTIKLSSVPFLLVSIAILIHLLKKRNYRALLISVVVGVVIFAPWAARSVVQSGYLAFPVPQMDIFDLEWKMPLDLVREQSDIIRAWARGIPADNITEILDLPVREWAPLWFDELTRNRQVILITVALAPIFYAVVALIFRRRINKRYKKFFSFGFVYLATYSGVVFWFFTLPSWRFGYGFLMFAFVLSILPFFILIRMWKTIRKTALSILLPVFLIAFQGFTLYQSLDIEALRDHFIYPADYKVMPTSPCEFKNFTIFCGDYYGVCWYEPFPCAPRGDPNVGLRGEDFEDGFYSIDL